MILVLPDTTTKGVPGSEQLLSVGTGPEVEQVARSPIPICAGPMARLEMKIVSFVVPVPTEFETVLVEVADVCANASVGRQKHRQRSSVFLKGTV